MDLCILTGKGKSGAVCALQKSVRPNVVTLFPFPTNYNDMWTLNDGENEHHRAVVKNIFSKFQYNLSRIKRRATNFGGAENYFAIIF